MFNIIIFLHGHIHCRSVICKRGSPIFKKLFNNLFTHDIPAFYKQLGVIVVTGIITDSPICGFQFQNYTPVSWSRHSSQNHCNFFNWKLILKIITNFGIYNFYTKRNIYLFVAVSAIFNAVLKRPGIFFIYIQITTVKL